MTFLQKEDVASLIGFPSGRAFLRARARLEEDQDFPPPMPTCLRPLIWRREEVERWQQSHGCAVLMEEFQDLTGHENVHLLREAATP